MYGVLVIERRPHEHCVRVAAIAHGAALPLCHFACAHRHAHAMGAMSRRWAIGPSPSEATSNHWQAHLAGHAVGTNPPEAAPSRVYRRGSALYNTVRLPRFSRHWFARQTLCLWQAVRFASCSCSSTLTGQENRSAALEHRAKSPQ